MNKFDAWIVLNWYADQIQAGLTFGVIVGDFYDNDRLFADAINELVPDFEYPDWKHLTIFKVVEKIRGLNK